MNKTWIALGGLLLVFVLIPGCLGITGYNRLVQHQETVEESWAQVENVLQRRYEGAAVEMDIQINPTQLNQLAGRNPSLRVIGPAAAVQGS